jgi:hypothetical protein
MLGLFGILDQGNYYETPHNEVAHPTTRSQNTSLSDDDLVEKIARCWMRDLVKAIFKVLVIGSYTLSGDLVIGGTTVFNQFQESLH